MGIGRARGADRQLTQAKVPSKSTESAHRSAMGAALAGCPVHDLRTKLRAAGLRPTRQRVALGWLLFTRGDRHVSAEQLLDEAQASRVPISLATIYNCLHQFTEAGLLREVAVDGSKAYFDTNVSHHDHFLIEGANMLIDIPQVAIDMAHLPEPPKGTRISRVEVVVRLRPED
jgi:Fur family transcriptional regulator, iron response regulator